MKAIRNRTLLLAGLLLAGCAGGQPANSGAPKSHQVEYAQKPVDIQSQEVHGGDVKDFPALNQSDRAAAQFGIYRIECQSDHKAYFSYGSADRVLIGDFSNNASVFASIQNSAHGSSPVYMVDFFDLSQAISGLPPLLISNMKSSDAIPPLVDLAKLWSSKGSITLRLRTSKISMTMDARLSADMRDRLGRELDEYSNRMDVKQTQPAR